MKSIFSFFCFITTLHGYIGDTVTLWDVNQKNEARRIILFGDYHAEHENANAEQYAAIISHIKKRADSSSGCPLSILLEQSPAYITFYYENLLLNRFSKQALKDPEIALGVSIKNIEMRAADILACSLLGTQGNIRDSLNGIEDMEFEDCDSFYKPVEIRFDDLFKSFEVRKKQIKEKSERLGIEPLITSYFDSPDHNMRLFDRDLKKLNIDTSEAIVDIIEKNQIGGYSDNLQRYILLAFATLFDLNAVCNIRTMDHTRDILMLVGAGHINLISYLLQQTGAWDISYHRYPSPITMSKPAPLSNEQLDILSCKPSYIKYVQMKLYQYARMALQYSDA